MADEEWYSVTRTWYVRAPDWYSASRAARAAGGEDDLRIHRHGQNDPRQWLPSANIRAATGVPDEAWAFEYVAKLWRESGETTRSVARRVGCSHTTVAALVNGTRMPRGPLLERIIIALGGEVGKLT